MRTRPVFLLTGLSAVLAIAAPTAFAQNTTQPATQPTTQPQPKAPQPQPKAPPERTFLPGLERFSLPGSGQQPTTQPPASTPPATQPAANSAAPQPNRTAPTPAPQTRTVAPPPVVQRGAPLPQAAPDTQIIQRQLDQQMEQIRERDRQAGATQAQPAPGGIPTVANPSAPPQPIASEAAPAPAPERAVPVWLWYVLGAVAILLVALGGFFLARRRSVAEVAPVPERTPVADPVGPPARLGATNAAPGKPAAPATPRASAPVAGPPVPPARYVGPLSLEFRPIAIGFERESALLEFELFITNAGNSRAEAVRAMIGLMAANPRQDELIAGFHMAPPVQPAGDPVTLAPGERHRIAGSLVLPASGVHVVQLGNRPMFVPIALIDLRWQAGLSLRRDSVDFMVGTPGQGNKLGPIWLDDAKARFERLAATRYVPKPMPAAAE